MRLIFATSTRTSRALRAASLGLGASLLLGAGVAGAQQVRNGSQLERTTAIQRYDATGGSEMVDLSTLRPARGFDLFAQEDQAFAGLKMTGQLGTYVTNDGGPCPYYFALANPPGDACLVSSTNIGTVSPYFTMGWVAAAPIHEFRKIRTVHPGVANMQAPVGYTSPYWMELVGPLSFRWGPADGQFGFLFAGVTSTNDGSCRDITGFGSGRIVQGVTLAAMSDCPETWPAAGFPGRRVLPDSIWQQRFAAQGNAFRWDGWKIPDEAYEDGALGDVGTTVATSDFYREQLQRYGSVTPRGVGAPTIRGYPLGLEIRTYAWQFSRPSLRNVAWFENVVVNKSADVYGQGIDYDSLYMGIDPGVLISGAGLQGGAWYFDFNRNTVIIAKWNQAGLCTGTYPRRVPATAPFVSGGCPSTTAANTGVWGIVHLKSPLGDTRNKLFTQGDPSTNPYYNPSHPAADDTITFNRATVGGFGIWYNFAMARSDRALFGRMATKEEETLDGRTIGEFTTFQNFVGFQSERLAEFDGAVTPETARYNRFVPGSTLQPDGPNAGQPYGTWDYDNDGIQDTISVPGCGQFGCHVPFSDTLPGGTTSIVRNIGNTVSAGPFKLAAGDTTQFIYAFIYARDTSAFNALLQNTISAYQTNYAGASPIAPPTFTADQVSISPATLRDSLDLGENTQIRIQIRQPESTFDPFIQSVADRIVRDSASPRLRRILNMNPGLLEKVQQRAQNNFAELLVFFSCNQGTTFSLGSGTNCTPADATDDRGNPINATFGWQPLFRIAVDSTTGRLTAGTLTHTVTSGRRYLYSFVTRTRGLIGIEVFDSIGGQIARTNLGEVLFVDADTINSPLFRSGPNVVDVYAPISAPAGTRFATVDTATAVGRASRRLTGNVRSANASGTFETHFANRFIVTRVVDTVTNQTVENRVTVQRVLGNARDRNGGSPQSNFVAWSETFTGPRTVAITNSQGAVLTRTRRSASGSVVTFIDTLSPQVSGGLGFLLADANGGQPRHIALNYTSPSLPRFEDQGVFNGVSVEPAALFGFNAQAVSHTLRSEGDTLPVAVQNNSTAGVRIQQNTSAPTDRTSQGGRYELTWAGDPYGPGAPFRLGTPDETQAAVNASLAQVQTPTTTVTGPEIEALVGGTRELIAARVPFTVRNPRGELVRFAMRARASNTRLLGTPGSGDTVRVSVPEDLWLPGDTLILIEDVVRDSLEGNVTVVADTTVDGRTFKHPVQTLSTVVGFQNFIVGCATLGTQQVFGCNPIALGTRGATGYLPPQAGWRGVQIFERDFDLFSTVRLTALPTEANRTLTSSDMDKIRVVPNPYIVASAFDQVDGARQATSRVYFTSVPSEGVLRIYTISGQLVQQISWTEADLVNQGRGFTQGDLPYNLRTREGLELGSGLYLYVLTATGPNANGQVARGKFVVIR